jgi:hypothetical protein
MNEHPQALGLPGQAAVAVCSLPSINFPEALMPAEAGNLRKQTRAGKASRQRFRDECAAADAVCWLCGMAIDYAAPYNDWHNDERFQVDHFVPVTVDAALQDDPSNYRASHAGCNNARSNGSPVLDLGIPSRAWT